MIAIIDNNISIIWQLFIFNEMMSLFSYGQKCCNTWSVFVPQYSGLRPDQLLINVVDLLGFATRPAVN